MTNPLDEAQFAENPEPRCPVVLLLDTSASMQGDPINELNAGLKAFSDAVKEDKLAALRVEVALVGFGGAAQVLDGRNGNERVIGPDASQAFVTVDVFQPPTLTTAGDTPMGSAVRIGLQLLRDRKDSYKQNSIDYFRPWLFLVTDGHPTDEWQTAAQQVKDEEGRKSILFFAVGVQNADMQTLAAFSAQRPPLKLNGLAFGELFQWLSRSVSAVAHSKPGDQAPLPPVGWGTVETSR
jgi:uncharacterized protein YegL